VVLDYELRELSGSREGVGVKLVVTFEPHSPSSGFVLRTADGEMLPGQIKVSTVNAVGELPRVIVEFVIDGDLIAWD